MNENPVARFTAYRRSGYAAVTVYRGACVRRYRVSLRRYAALREWTSNCTWKHRSGSWLRHGIDVYFWPNRTGEAEL